MKYKQKLHTTETVSKYFELDACAGTTWAELMSACPTMRAVGDLLEHKFTDAKGTYSMYLKQVGSIGCPSWSRPRKRIAETDALAVKLICISISVFF